MTATNLNIYIADDQTLFRKGMVRLLKSFSFTADVREAANGKEIIKLVKEKTPDVILMDYEMPIMDGKEASAYILKNYPDVKIIMLSFHNETSHIIEMMQMGTHSYLIKNAEPEEVKKAIQAVVQNDFYNNELVAAAMRQGLVQASTAKPKITSLSDREIEVLKLTCEELSSKEIADKLNISDRTVQNHRANLIQKLGVRNTIGMVRFAYEHHLLD
jgi:DNA-binding NarL/FixJ family response regulator